MTTDDRPWIKLDQSMPDNPKVMPLSDSAFRLYITALCWTARHKKDGRLPKGVLRALGTPARIKELVAAELLDEVAEGYEIHDYLKHQMSADDVATAKRTRREDGAIGAHIRHHVKRKRPSEECAFCLSEGLIPAA